MSASKEKKNRQVARDAGTDKKTLAAVEEAKKQKKSKIKWTVSTIAVILVIALVVYLNTGVLYTKTTAVSIDGEDYTPAEMNYYYSNQFYGFANQYGQYASIFGLDTRTGLAGLDSQLCPMLGEDGGSWKDYFLQAAEQEMIQTSAILKYAEEKGISLSDEEIAMVDDSFIGMDDAVKAQGFTKLDKFFAANYGNGVDKKLVRESSLDSMLVRKTIEQVSSEFDFSDKELEDYYKSLNGMQDIFDYAYFFVAPENVESTNEAGETVNNPTDETRAEAKATAEAIEKAYKDAKGPDALQNFNDAIASQAEDASATHNSRGTAANFGVYKDWLMGSHKSGDMGIVENTDGNGQYVVLFLDRSDNHYPMAQVRHILVQAESAEDGSYSDEAKAAAKAKAEDILNEWKSGDKTEDSFAELANKYSADPGSNTRGGLYDNVAKGQMVEEFDRFCFEGHKAGDTGIVYGESGGVPGYHVMFYVGEGDLYSNYIAENALSSQGLDEWITSLTEGIEATHGFGLRMVG